jgi:hypothetical protein
LLRQFLRQLLFTAPRFIQQPVNVLVPKPIDSSVVLVIV